MFQEWKNLIIKPTEKPVKKPVYKKEVEAFRNKRNNNLMKRMIDAWRGYERSPKGNISLKPIFCSF